VTDHGADQRWMTSVSPSSMTMPTASSWIEHYFPNYNSGGPHTPFSPPSHGQLRMGQGFPWESHGNGNSFWATDGNGNNDMTMWILCVKSPIRTHMS